MKRADLMQGYLTCRYTLILMEKAVSQQNAEENISPCDKGNKAKDVKNYIMRSFIICTPHEALKCKSLYYAIHTVLPTALI